MLSAAAAGAGGVHGERTAGYGQAHVLSQNSITQHCFWRHRHLSDPVQHGISVAEKYSGTPSSLEALPRLIRTEVFALG